MKFQVDRDVMAEAVAWASRTLPTKSTQPLLTGMHLVADKNGLVLSGSDADVSARANLSAEVIEAGTVLIPGRLLADITRSLPSSIIDFALAGNRAQITCGRSSFTIPTMPVAEYPPLPNMPAVSGSVSGTHFASAIAQVAIAASRDETLPAFTGVKIDAEGATLTLAATDRYRLAVRELNWSPNSTSLSTHALIPAKFLTDSSKSLAHSESISLAFATGNEGLVGIEGLGRQKVKEVVAGDICAIVGMEQFEIGDTVADFEQPEALKSIAIDEPTMSMLFTINDSPFFGKDGKFVTSRHIKDRLDKELEKNLALRVKATESADRFMVYGRGVLHLSVLIETMRREGYELQIGQPQVIIKEIDGVKCEPVEQLTIDLPETVSGKAVEMVSMRKGELLSMETKGTRMICEFTIPSRGIIGLRNQLLTATAGEAIMSHRFIEYQPFKGIIPSRINGSLVSLENGTAIPYSIDKIQERGVFFIDPGEDIYEGQVIGENSRADDMGVNVTKTKKLSNVRASGTDDKAKIVPAIKFSLEQALEYIQKDELVEVTPSHIRLRKVYLKETDRKRAKD